MSRPDRSEANKLRLLRSAKTIATAKFGMGGRPKERNAPKPITLARLCKCLPGDTCAVCGPT